MTSSSGMRPETAQEDSYGRVIYVKILAAHLIKPPVIFVHVL